MRNDNLPEKEAVAEAYFAPENNDRRHERRCPPELREQPADDPAAVAARRDGEEA